MYSYGRQSIDQSDIDAVVEVLKGDWLTQGPALETFENDLKIYFGSNHACAIANGTAALHLTGLALGWKLGDIVITTPTTFLATANSIVYAGATPDFVDIDPLTYTINPNLVEDKVKIYQSQGKKIKAVIGVDYAGHPCDWKALREIANKYDIQLVNDNCHALGASYLDDKQYAVKYADVVTQSYHPVKHITTGEGGAIFTNDAKIDEEVRTLRSHGMTKNPEKLDKDDGPWYYEMCKIGFNYRINDLQCALGISQLRKLDFFVSRRREIAKQYDIAFGSDEGFIIPSVSKNIGHAFHLYPLQLKFDELNTEKKHFFEVMKIRGIILQVHYIPVHLQPYYQRNYDFRVGDFPYAEQFYKNEISIPIYPDLLFEQQQQVINSINHSINI